MKNIIIYLDVSGASTAALHCGDSVNNSLRPQQLLTAELEKSGYVVKSSSDIPTQAVEGETGLFYGFHSHKKYTHYLSRSDIHLCAYFYLEPPVVKPGKYQALKKLSRDFHRVYLPNVEGVGYSLRGVGAAKLRRVFYPQAFDNKVDELWNKTERKFLIMINANKRLSNSNCELYSKRLEAVVELSKHNAIDLYGMGWRSWKKNGSYYWPYLKNRRAVLSVYKGPVEDKYETLSNYQFSLCFENMVMPGYITEKIFDCLFVGTVPVYWGAPDITDYVPANCFIDMRNFDSYSELYEHLISLTDEDVADYRRNIQQYLEGDYQHTFSTSSFVTRVKADVQECIKLIGKDE